VEIRPCTAWKPPGIYVRQRFVSSITPLYTIDRRTQWDRPSGERGGDVNRKTVRTLLTIMMYAGVGIFLLPYAVGKVSTAPLLMLSGGIICVVCGLLRCYLTEDE
jgi:hypothetical protein